MSSESCVARPPQTWFIFVVSIFIASEEWVASGDSIFSSASCFLAFRLRAFRGAFVGFVGQILAKVEPVSVEGRSQVVARARATLLRANFGVERCCWWLSTATRLGRVRQHCAATARTNANCVPLLVFNGSRRRHSLSSLLGVAANRSLSVCVSVYLRLLGVIASYTTQSVSLLDCVFCVWRPFIKYGAKRVCN